MADVKYCIREFTPTQNQVGMSHRTFPTADIYPDDLPNWSAVAVADENENGNEKA